MDIQISIIIVNFNTADLLSDCLKSIYAESRESSVEIIVVDNNSVDDSVDVVLQCFPETILIENTDNKGFAAANNQGIKQASGKYIWLLNPDTVVFPGCISKLYDFMENHPEAGAVSPRTWLDINRTLEVCSLKLLTPERARSIFMRLPYANRPSILNRVWEIDTPLWSASEPTLVEGIGGAAFFLSRELLNSLSGLDEQFFMGYEDTDLSAGLKNLQKNIYIHPKAEIVHLFGQAKQLPEAPAKATYAWQAAPMTFLSKYHGDNAVRKLAAYRFIDRFWRRLNPVKPTGRDALTCDDGVHLTWESAETDPVFLEISNDIYFFDKFGKLVTGNTFHIGADILNRLAGETWFWRILHGTETKNSEILDSGTWHWKKTQKNT